MILNPPSTPFSDSKSSPNPFFDYGVLRNQQRRGLNTSISHNLHSLTINPLSTPFSDSKSSPNPPSFPDKSGLLSVEKRRGLYTSFSPLFQRGDRGDLE